MYDDEQEEQYEPRKWDDVTNNGLYNHITSLHFNHDAALTRRVIEALYERMRDDIPIPYEVLCHFLQPAFKKIIRDKKSADEAFGLKVSKGQHARRDTFNRDMAIAAFVILEVRSGKNNVEGAHMDAAEMYHVSEPTVARAYKRFEGLRHVPGDLLKELATN